jgi:hypothetical protein
MDIPAMSMAEGNVPRTLTTATTRTAKICSTATERREKRRLKPSARHLRDIARAGRI